ncbi:PHP domain protein [Denitrovibrio acetiphilus DSM 12809]|uniref:PHP domain protein n=1 Tax=Denitrovibrio acetiphilus (strain DSM 12809 / NBRC 114555 / N2460) TaxID=522772 RepID=D4H7W5_DENA2|nr:PHP domain-containing protein [Denitrovibrio acetiphilus]ADD68114.1 PHP domain protein [Denitrovibrio acetiphilus DSM 12809]
MNFNIDMFDLHMHSDHSSDGVLSPDEILTVTRSRGINMFSITDHNSVASADVMKWNEGKYGSQTLYINGVELSLYHGDREVHVCAYGYNASCNTLAGILEVYHRNRILQTELRIEKLQDSGFRVDYGEVMQAAGGKMPSGVTMLKVLARYPENREALFDYLEGEKSNSPYTNFYFDYFTKGGKGYVHVPLLDFYDTVEKMKDKAVLIIAHPSLYTDRHISELVIDGIDGIEAYSSYHSAENVEYYKQYARDNKLLVTAGSDFHGERIKPGIHLGGHGCTDKGVAEKFLERVTSYEKGYIFI